MEYVDQYKEEIHNLPDRLPEKKEVRKSNRKAK